MPYSEISNFLEHGNMKRKIVHLAISVFYAIPVHKNTSNNVSQYLVALIPHEAMLKLLKHIIFTL